MLDYVNAASNYLKTIIYLNHFIVRELGCNENDIHVIPNSSEKYISFSKTIQDKFNIKFIDTFRFMSESLSSLADNLSEDKTRFRETLKIFSLSTLNLVTRKGVFSYEYIDHPNKLNETCLPPKQFFYNSLKNEDISDKDYAHAHKENIVTYTKQQIDLCLQTLKLDASHFMTAPGFAFDCMLKHTNVKLERLKQYDIQIFLENGLRGGICHSVKRHVNANIPNIQNINYDTNKPVTWLAYLDCVIVNGLKVKKVHRILRFSQSRWMAPYINLCTNMRVKSRNKFERQFWKLLVNSVYGKCMENNFGLGKDLKQKIHLEKRKSLRTPLILTPGQSGGTISLIPIFAGLSALGSLMSGSASEKKLMNTLPNRPLTSRDIIKYVAKFNTSHIRVVFSRDNLPKKPLAIECGILNLDISSSNGSHWVAFYKIKDKVEYFDSFESVTLSLSGNTTTLSVHYCPPIDVYDDSEIALLNLQTNETNNNFEIY
ncbi:hypothetical protein AGLY_018230 [Aphis glycines]|uniref:DNA-directed DNA polymerase n=1 Tax=Aphis glycines TaxID=307491 RepID=A0A6G0STD2_APHGL|nr:hypothetical protein AGLY_018230 [Aphis glycines]